MNPLLHDSNFKLMPLSGRYIKHWMQARALRLADDAQDLQDSNVSIVIRTRNDGKHIRRLFEDIRAQAFDGAVEIIVVDTASEDDTATYAASQGAKVISLTQKEFTYPRALNLGFQMARYPWVVTLVGHSSLSNRFFLRSLTYWSNRVKGLGGMYSMPLANWDASIWERVTYITAPWLWKEPRVIKKLSMGIMGANSSVLKREVWEQLGGYDERYAGGGEDRAFARTMLEHTMPIVWEPLLSVFHSHGLGARNSVKQWLHWGAVAKAPTPFVTAEVHKRRPGLR